MYDMPKNMIVNIVDCHLCSLFNVMHKYKYWNLCIAGKGKNFAVCFQLRCKGEPVGVTTAGGANFDMRA